MTPFLCKSIILNIWLTTLLQIQLQHHPHKQTRHLPYHWNAFLLFVALSHVFSMSYLRYYLPFVIYQNKYEYMLIDQIYFLRAWMLMQQMEQLYLIVEELPLRFLIDLKLCFRLLQVRVNSCIHHLIIIVHLRKIIYT